MCWWELLSAATGCVSCEPSVSLLRLLLLLLVVLLCPAVCAVLLTQDKMLELEALVRVTLRGASHLASAAGLILLYFIFMYARHPYGLPGRS